MPIIHIDLLHIGSILKKGKTRLSEQNCKLLFHQITSYTLIGDLWNNAVSKTSFIIKARKKLFVTITFIRVISLTCHHCSSFSRDGHVLARLVVCRDSDVVHLSTVQVL